MEYNDSNDEEMEMEMLKWWACLCAVFVCFGQSVDASTVPFVDAFDYPDGTSLDGTHGWDVTGPGSVTVTNNRARLQQATLANPFDDAQMAVRIAFELAPQFVVFTNDVPSLGIPRDATYAFYVTSNGLITAYNGQTPTNLVHTPLVENVATQFAVEVDHPVKRWSLWVGDSLVAEDLQFYGATGDTLMEIGFSQLGSNDVAFLDAVDVGSMTSSVSSISLPFYEPFEALTLGALDGQNEWSAQGALVQGRVVYQGVQAACVTNPTERMTRNFFGSHTNVWTELSVRPAFGEPWEGPPTGSSFAFYVNTNGNVVAYDGNAPTEYAHLTIASNQWVTFMVQCDYSIAKWNLYLDRVTVAEGLDFFDAGATAHEQFGLIGADPSGSYVDDIRVQTSQPSEVIPLASFAIANAAFEESVAGAEVTVSLDRASTNVVMVEHMRIGGSATGGADYTHYVADTLTFAPGQVSTSFTFSVINDSLDEPAETIVFGLGALLNALPGANTNYTYTILEDKFDDPPTVYFGATVAIIAHDAGPVSLPVELFPPQAITVRVDHAVSAGTAVDGVDYTNYTPGTIVFNPGETNGSLSFTTIPNVGEETDRTLVFTLADPENATVGFPGDITVLIGQGDSNDWFNLPFVETFESRTLGDLDTQRGWVGTYATVQTNVTRSGSKALAIVPPTNATGSAAHVFLAGHRHVWTDIWVRPAFGAPPGTPSGSTFGFYVTTNGYVMAYDGGTAKQMGLPSPLREGAWARFSVESDYGSKTWDLWVNSLRVGIDLDFRSSGASSYSEFGMVTRSTSNDVAHAYLDNLSITTKRPPGLHEMVLIIR